MYRSRSIARLILTGFAVIMTPLIAAVVTAVIQVDRLAEHGRAAVLEAETATQQSQSLFDSLIEMRRASLQYRVTEDGDFFDIYLDRRREFLDAFRGLARTHVSPRTKANLDEIARQEQQLFRDTRAAPSLSRAPAAVAAAEKSWSKLNDLASSTVDDSRKIIEAQVNLTTDQADALQRTLLLQAAAVIPGTILLAILFVILITRPMREIAAAIRRLGARQLSETISVSGPSDVEDLGMLLDWLRRRIVKLEDQKMTFLRQVSHELKTPLTTIREGSELLAESLTDDRLEEAEISRIIRANSVQLQTLIENLLHFSETQDVVEDVARLEPVDLRALIENTVAAHSLAIAAKRIDVVTELGPATVRGDVNKLRVVIDNLLSNATKYTPVHGRIGISLHVAEDRAVLDVEDTGPGIDPGDTERIFEPFQRGDTECESCVKGTGLGLSIAKSLIEAHDGSIRVVGSTRGAHFQVSMPIVGPVRVFHEDLAALVEPRALAGA